MLASVDLPAPFSPRSAWTSPSRASKSTESLAKTPGKRLVIERMATAGDAPAVALFMLVRCRRLPGPLADDGLDEPVHRQDLVARELGAESHLHRARLVGQRPGELIEGDIDQRLLLRVDR